MGREASTALEATVKQVHDRMVTEYVNRVGQILVQNSDAKVSFTIRVIDSEEINAFAFPGGFLYVNSGLILAAQSEAELAGVMAHEIAHVAARHATRPAAGPATRGAAGESTDRAKWGAGWCAERSAPAITGG